MLIIRKLFNLASNKGKGNEVKMHHSHLSATNIFLLSAIFFFHFKYTCIAHIFIELISLVRSHFFCYIFLLIYYCVILFSYNNKLKKILYRFFFHSHKWKEAKAKKCLILNISSGLLLQSITWTRKRRKTIFYDFSRTVERFFFLGNEKIFFNFFFFFWKLRFFGISALFLLPRIYEVT